MLAALPDLGALAAVAACLLAAAALWVAIIIVRDAFGHTPLVGGWISREIGGWLNDARNAALRGAAASWGAAVKLFDWSIALERVVFGSVLRFALETGITIDHIVTRYVPLLFRLAVGQAVHYYRLAEADLRNGQRLLRLEFDAAVRRVELRAEQYFRISQRDLINAERAAAVNLARVQRGIITDLKTTGDIAVRDVWRGAEGDIEALRRVLGNDFPWLKDLLGALGGLGAAGLLGALIRSVAGAEAITKLATDCIVPNCRDLGSFPSSLANLLGEASDAALLAWVIFMITDPHGWAADMERFALDPAQRTIADAASLLGHL